MEHSCDKNVFVFLSAAKSILLYYKCNTINHNAKNVFPATKSQIVNPLMKEVKELKKEEIMESFFTISIICHRSYGHVDLRLHVLIGNQVTKAQVLEFGGNYRQPLKQPHKQPLRV